ncbi:hypothetical protein DFR50_103209 [Roseiarcus fermentans]|uniref:Uncharacterized protein n=1 Tax=Roseiarcus fermentans TaxID=1473586 RepID=A0A366FRN7_9HYPH|nr:hypothetical protein [Roseiarcus fermentans]RBP17322.1 hypothetical protein DFR50_103209 [Roseiarcus fermentans]
MTRAPRDGRRGRRRWGSAAAFAVCLPVGVALAAGSPIPALTPVPSAPSAPPPPMRILRVTSSDPACQPNCPEWISAEGIISRGTASALAKALDGLGGRRLPILISSYGGSVRDALDMGRLIRARRLAVAVARTLVANCPQRARECPDARGRAMVDGAVCASACPFVLAAGVARLVGPAPRVGVHQITTVFEETEGADRPRRTVKVYEQDWVDRTVAAYLASAGVGEPVMEFLRRTPAASIRWLSLDEIKASRLASEALDPAAPISTEGGGGLAGFAFGDLAKPDVMTATAPDRGGLGAVLTLTYRRGGGALELALARAGERATKFEVGFAPAPGASLASVEARERTARPLLPRDRFCARRGDGPLVVTAAGPASPPLAFDLAGAADVEALAAEACP